MLRVADSISISRRGERRLMNKGDTVISLVVVLFLGYVHFYMGDKRHFDYQSQNWAEHVLKGMSLEEKVAQTLMPIVCVDEDVSYQASLQHMLKTHKVGGVLMFQYHPSSPKNGRKKYDPTRQVAFINRCQRQSQYPLLVTADAEWGLGMRFSGAMNFPKNRVLGSLKNKELVYKVGKEIGRQCKAAGVHFNFAPVVDIDSNPQNPIIGMRAFGRDKDTVVANAREYIRGMRSEGILACIKHFPGHGDTYLDSHKTLPVLHHSKEQLWAREILPFQEIIKDGIDSVMIGHLYVPALQGEKKEPSSLSSAVITKLLKHELGFGGLVFTDAFAHMKAITDNYAPGQAELLALKAGADIVVDVTDVSKTIDLVKNEIELGNWSEDALDTKVLKILKTKEALRLHEQRFVKIPSWSQMFTAQAFKLHDKVCQQAKARSQGLTKIA